MKIYSISYMATKNDNGHVLSYFSRQEAEESRLDMLNSGYYHVSNIW